MSDRKIWFIPRPERDPLFHMDALKALDEATEHFTQKWERNRKLHQRYEEVLVKHHIKKDNISNDGSGGRTWAALPRAFGYCYINPDGYLVLTKVGKAILNQIKIKENVTKQILTLQIPNAYFLSKGFKPKFEEGFAIRPSRFLIKLCLDDRLQNYITKQEITLFAMTAKKDSDLERVIQEILNFRVASPEKRERIKAEIVSKFEHRERSDKGARDFEVAHSDVAHTYMLITGYTELVEYVRGESVLRINPNQKTKTQETIDRYDERYPFNNRHEISVYRLAENNGLDVDSYKASSLSNNKPISNADKKLAKALRLISDPDPSSLSIDQLAAQLSKEFPNNEALTYAAMIHDSNETDTLKDDFITSYLNEINPLTFEDKTGQILVKLGFQVVMRPKLEKYQTQIEILVKYGDHFCGIFDAKLYSDTFSLSAQLASHMASEYIPNYDGYEDRELKFFGYIVSNKFSADRNLKIIATKYAENTGKQIQGIMLNAKTLIGFLDHCIENDLPKEKRLALFLSAIGNRSFKNAHDFLKATNENDLV